jgi:hypothetical protein
MDMQQFDHSSLIWQIVSQSGHGNTIDSQLAAAVSKQYLGIRTVMIFSANIIKISMIFLLYHMYSECHTQ